MSEHADHGIGHYIKIYLILLVLLIVSIIGPELGIRSVTLITAFGIAIVKAVMVASYFMHLNVEKRYIWYMLIGMLALVAVFFYGVAPDVMKSQGSNWENKAAKALIHEHATKSPDEHAAPH